ncbi:hypothetical protein D6851_08605 [Altericroceibacterium spongiae]|uniref:Lipoprotein n=1 Tax=Altericroceibacterium spongiae TaxID=2320269 RepID=A0A420EJV9_9SPHN|nr:hypothetical protein [Altericroceibacterium spongiae]RKF21002.1 hypothetical protein D6851_08605 [Altericroceibacterium spongiae]
MIRRVPYAALLVALSPAILLTACSGGKDSAAEKPAGDEDPGLSGALGDQITVDPDLVGQNEAANAATTRPASNALPPEARGAQAIALARTDAQQMVGGASRMKVVPQAETVAGQLPASATLTAAARAAASPAGQGDCAKKARYTMQWAAKLPETFPVYPRGSVQEAAGTDEGRCSLRVVNFQTAVPLTDVLNFYYTRAANAGFSAQHVRDGREDVLGGVKGASSYVVYARKLEGGTTEVDLITSGG